MGLSAMQHPPTKRLQWGQGASIPQSAVALLCTAGKLAPCSKALSACTSTLLLLFLQVTVCKEQVEWAITEKRTFLRQRIQLRLASLYLDTAEYQDSLKIVGT